MRIRIDEVDFALPEGAGNDKKSIFEAVKREVLGRNRVISQVIVDGNPLDDQDLFCTLAAGAETQFVTQPIRELVAQSMDEGTNYVPLLKSGLESVATDFEAGRDGEAMGKFTQAVEGINWLISVFDRSCILLGVTTDMLASGRFDKDMGDMRNALEEMTAAMENGKNMALAYLIREKLLPAIDRFSLYWSEVSSQLDTPLQ